jgi:hypothetical protein
MNRPRIDRCRQTGWMDGYRPQTTIESACADLEVRLMAREGRRVPFPDAIAREPLERDWWAL